MAFSEHQNSNSLGSLDFPKTNQPVEAVMLCIQQGLEQFAIEFKGTPIQNEPGLTQHLCDIFSEIAVYSPFWFDKENMQDTSTASSPRTDIGVKTSELISIKAFTFQKRQAFFELEAKRLPAPTSRREKEYVIGNDKKMGGIERFKIGKHGKNVLFGGLIGFIQQNEFNHWQTNINSWISELFDDNAFWNTSDQLVLDKMTSSVAVFHSSSKREFGVSESINLIHWWVKMN